MTAATPYCRHVSRRLLPELGSNEIHFLPNEIHFFVLLVGIERSRLLSAKFVIRKELQETVAFVLYCLRMKCGVMGF